MRLTSLALACSLLTGCSSVSRLPPEPPAPAPSSWTNAGPTATGQDWQSVANQELRDLQALALDRHPMIGAASARFAQSKVRVKETTLRLQPSASIESASQTQLGTSSPSNSRSRFSFSASYEVDLWGRLESATSEQAAYSAQAQADIQAARASVSARLAEHYWSLGAAKAQAPLARQQLSASRLALEYVQERVAAGKMLPIEIDKAAVNVQAAELRLANATADAATSLNGLVALLGHVAGETPAPNASLPTEQPPSFDLGAPVEVLERRPDVQRSRAAVDAALARLHSAEAARYPRLTFRANADGSATSLADAVKNPLGFLAANLMIPMVDWNRLESQRIGAEHELRATAFELRSAVATALEEVENLLAERTRLGLVEASSRSRLKQAQAARDLAMAQLDAGKLAKGQAAESVAAHLSAQQDLLDVQLQQWLNFVAIQRAMAR
jgi:outer membrane protein TolC